MEPPLGSQPARTRLRPGGRCSQAGRGSPQAPTNRHTPLILNRQRSRDNLIIGQRQSLLRLNVIATPNGYLRHVPAPARAGSGLHRRKASARDALLALRRLSLALLLSALPRQRRGRRFLPRQGLGVFRHAWVSEKRSQTL